MHTFPSDTLLSAFAPLLPVDDIGIVAHQAPDFFALWEALEREAGTECDIPYWAAVWPGGRLLARYILQNPETVTGKTVLDFGSGGAVVSIAAARAGAKRVIANDIDPIAHRIAVKNGAANNETFVTEGKNLLTAPDNRTYDTVFVSDMFYERSTVDALLHFLQGIRARGTKLLIADGSRPFTPKTGLEVLAAGRLMVNLALEGCAERAVTLYRFVE
ncbi:MAG: methyltransferase [Chitinispirillaceae bacterium]|nr:methyltransferase [Chitinispirillaceae bacterium]